MNIQAMMKQAQNLQKNMLKEKEIIDNTVFEGTSSFVTVRIKGNKKIEEILINKEEISKEELEILQDILTVAINNAMNEIDKVTEEKMGKYTQGLPGLF